MWIFPGDKKMKRRGFSTMMSLVSMVPFGLTAFPVAAAGDTPAYISKTSENRAA